MKPGYLFTSPLGDIVLRAEDEALTGVFFVGQKHYPDLLRVTDQQPVPRIIALAREQLQEFFAGERQVFDLPLRARGTPFQEQVWQALARIPYGEIMSYGAMARQMGLSAGHSRAVGTANGRNPISIIVPCHRVVGAAGDLTGYAGGVERKRALLALEAEQGFRLA
ncbi:methylated-DNA--[protein]-cysteine S-methyltransferase [Pseudomonas sp. DTU_2021_1001937_2_SI_NGA_ILE_001]|uniref:methylated-DNA--[protein]-cysteine S-methyltransferase n=1 Tax=Pseudomonas sp. DTU_2021_1001937_2_SI_NGA_ILE_001 TaxID=3077589 RepID=UPI0025D0904B|nr:methylated-DNA--[protein]-cysteine S-methyltransferase [Pseudomonas sp. DTU_2021_1001937_2_SI_NGA_ILE_001]WNW13313.1 methylated-DNA--[protein]-cysteine S-methyltransferase [Pseudomonas sp. DTU_2021_1001937_2_SI_NGA_ILE_001]